MDTIGYRYDTRIAYNQVDPSGKARSIAMMELLQEAAIEHCSDIGMDVFTLLSRRRGWMLRAGNLDLSRYPRYGEALRIDTWLSKWTAFTGTREFVLYTQKKEELARATTLWAYVDTEARRPVPVDPVFKERWQFSDLRAISRGFTKRPLTIPASHTTELFTVRRHDIDSNEHVHNVRYLEWVLESVPESYYHGQELITIDGSFIQEARPQDTILVQAGRVSDRELVHNVIRKTTGEVLSTGRSVWR